MLSKVLPSFLILSLVGCAATPLVSGSHIVRITNTEPGKECKFLGDVTGNQGDLLTGAWTSNENLETGARNALKNKAFAMGGNLIVLLTQRAGQTGSAWDGSGGSHQTNVTLSGNVYRCPD
jgi:hypothetical protein